MGRRCKIIPEEIEAIKAAYAAGRTLKEIGKAHGSTGTTVARALKAAGVVVAPRGRRKRAAPTSQPWDVSTLPNLANAPRASGYCCSTRRSI